MGIKISKQEDEKDCGLYVLQSLIKFFHNKNIDINYLKINSTYGKEGINLLNLKEIAAKNGLRLASYGGDFEALSSLKKENLPAILILNKNGRNHYVILNKIKGNKYYISDSVEGKQLKINAEELKQEFQNVVITVEPCAYESKKKNFKIDNKVKSLISIKNYTPILILSSIINVLLSFCSTFFVKIVFDIVLPNYMKKTLIVIFAAFIWIVCLRVFNLHFKNHVVKKIQNKIFIETSEAYFAKIKNTSINHLNKLTNTDLFKRASYIAYVAEYQANFAFTFVGELLSFAFSTLILIWLNYILFGVVFAVSAFLLLINFIYHQKIDSMYFKNIKYSLEKTQSDIDYINSRSHFENNDYESYLKYLWFSKTSESLKSDQTIFNSRNNNELISGTLLNNVSNIIVFISSILIMKNKLTSGDMMMFLTGVSFFLNPLLSMSKIFASQDLMKRLTDQLNFVFNLKSKDYVKDKGMIVDKIKSVSFSNLCFSYEEGNDILKIDEFKIDQSIQLVGDNGCGKSTLLKLIKGDFDNYKGRYCINGVGIQNINFEKTKNKLIYIPNNFYFPNIKIIDFITQNDQNKNIEFSKNFNEYKLENILQASKLNLNKEMVNNASNLSSGQRQIILFLRCFCQKYDLILLDEAFENIDPKISRLIKNNLKKYQKSAIFVEISHNKNFINKNKEVFFNEINKSI